MEVFWHKTIINQKVLKCVKPEGEKREKKEGWVLPCISYMYKCAVQESMAFKRFSRKKEGLTFGLI